MPLHELYFSTLKYGKEPNQPCMRLALNFPDLSDSISPKLNIKAGCLLTFSPELSAEKATNIPRLFIPQSDLFPNLRCTILPVDQEGSPPQYLPIIELFGQFYAEDSYEAKNSRLHVLWGLLNVIVSNTKLMSLNRYKYYEDQTPPYVFLALCRELLIEDIFSGRKIISIQCVEYFLSFLQAFTASYFQHNPEQQTRYLTRFANSLRPLLGTNYMLAPHLSLSLHRNNLTYPFIELLMNSEKIPKDFTDKQKLTYKWYKKRAEEIVYGSDLELDINLIPYKKNRGLPLNLHDIAEATRYNQLVKTKYFSSEGENSVLNLVKKLNTIKNQFR